MASVPSSDTEASPVLALAVLLAPGWGGQGEVIHLIKVVKVVKMVKVVKVFNVVKVFRVLMVEILPHLGSHSLLWQSCPVHP